MQQSDIHDCGGGCCFLKTVTDGPCEASEVSGAGIGALRASAIMGLDHSGKLRPRDEVHGGVKVGEVGHRAWGI